MSLRPIALFFILILHAEAQVIKLFHYNIKELDSTKLKQKISQLRDVYQVVHKKNVDILSINEIQYDLKNVPTPEFTTNGQNMQKLLEILDLQKLKFVSFHPANTGENAKTKTDGTYYINADTAEARSHADQLNFGVMPGQYSTGAATHHKILNERIIKDLKWKDFNPEVDFSKFAAADGTPIPDDMKLFDKNFSDISLDVAGKRVQLILLHTVPSYGFGNKKSINMLRNADQLKFLEWYLTGNTDFKVKLKNIKPLKKTDRFLAVGDFNVDINNADSPGAKVMLRILNKTNPWISPKNLTFTNEGADYSAKPFRLMLDYIVASRNIKILKGEIMHPDFKRVELGCEAKDETLHKEDLVKKTYKDGDKVCEVLVTKEYERFKNASDHYPIYGEFEL